MPPLPPSFHFDLRFLGIEFMNDPLSSALDHLNELIGCVLLILDRGDLADVDRLYLQMQVRRYRCTSQLLLVVKKREIDRES